MRPIAHFRSNCRKQEKFTEGRSPTAQFSKPKTVLVQAGIIRKTSCATSGMNRKERKDLMAFSLSVLCVFRG
jgi:hypothetical protein